MRKFLSSCFISIAILLAYLMTTMALIGTPFIALSQAQPDRGTSLYMVSVAIALVACAVPFLLKRKVEAWLLGMTQALGRIPARQWLLTLLCLGLLLRILWISIFPAIPASDGEVYLNLSRKLATGLPYKVAENYAFWPPGYPLFLSVWQFLSFPDRLIPSISNLLLFALTLPVVWALAEEMAGETAARIATALVAFWPSYLANVSTPEKENLLILLLPAVLLLYVRARHRHAWMTLPAGLLLGFGALVQPSLLLFVSVILCLELCEGTALSRIALRLGFVVLGMAIAITPWTLRNQTVLNQTVLISSNGGDVFYRANNPLATGGYTERGEVDLSHLGEVERGREGARLGREWITNHPAEFARLVLTKQMLFMGDDSAGVYGSLRRGGGTASNQTYLLLKALANAFWYALWVLVILFLIAQPRRFPSNALEIAVILGYGYFFVVHSIFESNGKYHLPAMPLLALIVASLISHMVQKYSQPAREAHR